MRICLYIVTLVIVCLNEILAFSGQPTKSNEIVKPSSRRNILKSGITAAAAVVVLDQNAGAAFGEDGSKQEPFRVIFSIQTDRSNEKQDDVEIEVIPDWAPLASARFKELVETGFYDGSRFHRVLPFYVAQFGISAEKSKNKEWIFCERNCKSIPDEPRLVNNKRGTLSFASSGKNSRQTQVFINLVDNDGVPNFLDAQGFVPFARIVDNEKNWAVVDNLNKEYGIQESFSGGMVGSVNQAKASFYGEEYLDALFPKLSVIKSAKIM